MAARRYECRGVALGLDAWRVELAERPFLRWLFRDWLRRRLLRSFCRRCVAPRLVDGAFVSDTDYFVMIGGLPRLRVLDPSGAYVEDPL